MSTPTYFDVTLMDATLPSLPKLKINETWKDYPRKKDKLAIVGFAPTTRHLAPFDDPEYEIWGVNEEYNYDWMKRFDRWFQIHPRWDFTRTNNMNHRNHFLWLQDRSDTCIRCNGLGSWDYEEDGEKKNTVCPDCKGTKIYTPPASRKGMPIYMQERHDDIPHSIEYPLREAMDLLPEYLWQEDYFTSTAALMLALAYLMGFKEVWFYGFEMGTQTEYHYQRANFEYLSGYFSALGMAVRVPEISTLFRGELYGYKNMKTGYRQNLEMRKSILEDQEKRAGKKVDIHTGKIQQLQTLVLEMQTEAMKKHLEESMREYQKIIGNHNVIKGALSEVGILIKLYDNYFLSGSEKGNENAEEVQKYVNVEYQNE